jgi:glycosyltransferase involved in cell wall biosynthesis
MIDKKILMVVSYDPEYLPNQPFFNVVRYFSTKFQEVDYATYKNLYAGPPVSLPQKIGKSFHNLLYDRISVTQEGNVKHLVTRRLKLPHSIQTMLSDLWAIINLPSWLKDSHYDICFYCCPQNTLLATWLKRSNIVNKVVYYDIDYFPDHVDARDPLSKKVLAWRERFAVNHADGVISVSKPLAQLRKSQGAKQVITIPNGVVTDHFVEARQKEPHPPTLIYVGLLSEAWGIDLVLEALPLIKQDVPEIRFIVVGSGGYSDELERMTSQLGLQNNVIFYGKQPYNELGKYMRKADVGTAVYKSRKFVGYASPMKIKDYMAAGLPVITSRIGEAEEIIRDSRAGELVDGTPTSIASAALRILTNKQLADEYTQAAIRYAPQLDWNAVLEPALDFIISL